MKLAVAFHVVMAMCLSQTVHGAESDVVRVFDDKLQLTDKKMTEYLRQADLERYGFNKTVEISTQTDEEGVVTKKKTIYYLLTDNCSRVKFWEGVLEQRLPKKLTDSKILQATVKEVEVRIAGRKTKSCTVGLEIHPTGNTCLKKKVRKAERKRFLGGFRFRFRIPPTVDPSRNCGLCHWCFTAGVDYDA